MDKGEKVLINFLAPKELVELAQAYCKANNTTLSAMIRGFLEEKIKGKKPHLTAEMEDFIRIQSLMLGMTYTVLERLLSVYQGFAFLLKAHDQEGTAQKMLEEMAELQKNLNVFYSLCKSLLEDYKPSSTLFETLAQRRRQLPADKSEGCPNNSQSH